MSRQPGLRGEASAATLQTSTVKAETPPELKNYRYVDRFSERTVSFPVDSAFDVQGHVKGSSSGALADYQDKLKAIGLREKGLEKAVIAQRLGRPERWVQRWWRENPKLLQRPAGAHDVVMQKASLESFRDLEIRRGFLQEGTSREEKQTAEMLRSVVDNNTWQQAKVMRRNQETGQLDLAYDNTGATVNSGRQVADYKAGNVACLDRLVQRIFATVDIRDTQARIFMNYYTDGRDRIGVHRHDFWTALVSLGEDRILTMDGKPVLMRDGDLVVFGTQSHGVPTMPDVSGERVSLVIFFYPDHDNLERRQWQTITEGESENAESTEELVASKGIDGGLNVAILWNGETSCGAGSAVTVFTVGLGSLSEKEFFEQLSQRDVKQLWDTRAPQDIRGHQRHVDPVVLRQCCAARQIKFRTASLGRKEAGGPQRHLNSEEGQNTLTKLISAARSDGILAILGTLEDWQLDARRWIADALVGGRFGDVSVIHLSPSGACPHPLPAPEQHSGAMDPQQVGANTSHGIHVHSPSLTASLPHADNVPQTCCDEEKPVRRWGKNRAKGPAE